MNNQGALIVGASGLIGRYLYQHLQSCGSRALGTYHSNGQHGLVHFDITCSPLHTLPLEGINCAIICSAITTLDRCKQDPELSYQVNVLGIERVLSHLDQSGILPVFLSSASVFDGQRGNYREDDERNPISVYGEQKVEVENFIFSSLREYLIIRPGKVFGLARGEGVLFSEWLARYKEGKPILCADDEQLSPTYAGDVAQGIQKLLAINARGVYHLNPPEHFSRYDLAAQFFHHLGITDVSLQRCSIDDFHFAEKRGKNTYLDASKFIQETGFVFRPLVASYRDVVSANGGLR